MKGLILKDWYQVLKSGKGLFLLDLFVLVLGFFSQNYLSIMIAFFSASTLGMSLMYADESDHWSTFVKGLPCSPMEIVFSKYIVMALVFLFMNLTASFVWITLTTFIKTWNFSQWLSLTLICTAIGLICIAFMYPCAFLLGPNDGRIVYGILMFVVMALMINYDQQLVAFLQDRGMLLGPVLLLLGSITLFGISGLVSVWCYRKRSSRS